MMQDHAGFIAKARLFYEFPRFLTAGDGIVSKRGWFQYAFTLIGLVSRTRTGNFILLACAVLFYRPLRAPSMERLFQYGFSENNERIFRKINESANRKEWDTAINGRPAPFWLRCKTVFGGAQIWRAAGALAENPGCHPFAHTQLVLACAAYGFFHCHGLSRIRLVCVANDHSPMSMALLRVAKDLGIRRCYLQHAPVTDYFPPLDYDLSVLSNRSTLHAYEQSAARHGATNSRNIVYLPPYESDFLPVRVGDAPFRIGLCLSYLYDETAVKSLVRAIEERPEVSQVLLRRHPRCKANLDLLRSTRTNECLDRHISDFLSQCDVLLVPNSGVAIECLHFGKPTFYVQGTDHIEDDYYRFVKNKVVPRFRFEILEEKESVLSFFDEAWKGRFSEYDETVVTPLNDLQRIAGAALLSFVE